jgi:RNA polymerase sigma-70 factor (ECF subfamily)
VPDNDQKIVDEIRKGDTRSYAVLVELHKNRALTLGVRLVGNRGEAEELVQDAFLRAYQNLGQFRGDAKFSTWFYRILYNLCMTKVARRRGKMSYFNDENELDCMLTDPDEVSVHEKLEEEETRQILAMEMDLLPEKFRTPVTLFYVQELTYEEIATVMDAPLGTVKTNLFRGRNLLRKRVLARMKDEVNAA